MIALSLEIVTSQGYSQVQCTFRRLVTVEMILLSILDIYDSWHLFVSDPDDPEYIRQMRRPAEVKEDLNLMDDRCVCPVLAISACN